MKVPKKNIVSCVVVFCVIAFMTVLYVGYRGFDNYIHMAQRAKRSEAPINLNEIRTAELEFFKVEGQYLPFEIKPDDLNDGYESNDRSTEHPEWERLGFKPEYQLRCHYKVELRKGGADFEATARCDLDQDGRFAVYMATSEKEVEHLTDNDIY